MNHDALTILDIAVYLILFAVSCFIVIPVGNDNSTVRRIPWVTFAIIAVNIAAFVFFYRNFDEDRVVATTKKLVSYLQSNSELLYDEEIRHAIERAAKTTGVERVREYAKYLGGATGMPGPPPGKNLDAKRERVQEIIGELEDAAGSQPYYFKWGLAPDGEWKAYQLVTSAFMHGGIMHLVGNLIFFFAIGFTLEDRWGRVVFLSFYLLSAAAACVPSVLNPLPVPLIGASGAIAATMGAFLIRLPLANIDIRWAAVLPAPLFLILRKRPWGRFTMPAYLYIPLFFLIQLFLYTREKRMGMSSGTAFSAHFAGCAFGGLFALMIMATRVEHWLLSPGIEAKVSFSAYPVVTQALEFLENGEVALAGRRLTTHLRTHPNDIAATMALVQVYERTRNYPQLTAMHARLINYHLANNEKRSALTSYENLLTAVGTDRACVRLPAREWFVLSEFLERLGRFPEAAIEYEWLAKHHAGTPAELRSYVKGGEAAVRGGDLHEAFRLFQLAERLSPPPGYAGRVSEGLEKCKARLDVVPAPGTIEEESK